MGDIPTRKIAGIFLILVPTLFWLFMYLRYDCGGGVCSIDMGWLIIGLAMVLFGLVILISTATKKNREEKEVETEEDASEEDTV